MGAEHIRANLADRTARRREHYEAMFGVLPVEPGQTLVNVGAGDSALGNELPGVDVIDVDYGYHKIPPLYYPQTGEQLPYRGTPIAALAREIPLEDDVSHCTVAAYLFMHMSTRNVELSIDEFIRITAPGGTVLIGPVWDDRGVTPDLANDFLSFRGARYLDGCDRYMPSLSIMIPEDKEDLLALGVSSALAGSEILYNRPAWRHMAMLTRQALSNMLSGSNRRGGRSMYELEKVPGAGSEASGPAQPPVLYPAASQQRAA